MDSPQFGALLTRMTQAICQGDGTAAAACFTADGTYHDGFYGAFTGHARIREMVEAYFHRDARAFWWHWADPVADGAHGYARYDFGYTATLAGAEGRAVRFAGISHCLLRDGLIAHYGEIFDRGPIMVQLGFTDERIMKSLRKVARQVS